MPCPYACVHPLWGGEGVCVEETHCECSAGFIDSDALGNPGCVPRDVLLAGYILVAVVGMVSSLFLIWHTLQHRHLPLSVRTSHRALLRQRLILSAGWYSVGCAAIFGTAASFGGNRSPWGNGICEAFYTFCYPSRVFAIAMVAALWVNSIPTSALPAASYATRHKKYSEKKQLYERLGLCSTAATFGAGVLSWFRPTEAMVVADVVSSFGEAVVGICIASVARQTISAIDRRSAHNSSSSSSAFYSRTKQVIVGQVRALLAAALIYVVATCMLHFSDFGKHTAILFMVVKFSDGMLWLCIVVHFARPAATSRFALRGSLVPDSLLTPTRGILSSLSGTGTDTTIRPLSYIAGGLRNIRPKVARVPSGTFLVVRAYIPANAIVPHNVESP